MIFSTEYEKAKRVLAGETEYGNDSDAAHLIIELIEIVWDAKDEIEELRNALN